MSKFRIVLLMILTALLLVRVLHAQDVKGHATDEGNDQYTIATSPDSVQDIGSKRATRPCTLQLSGGRFRPRRV